MDGVHITWYLLFNVSVSIWPLLCCEAFSGRVTKNILLLQNWIQGIMFGHKISENSRIQLDTSQVEFRNLKSTRKFFTFFTPNHAQKSKNNSNLYSGQLQFPNAIFHFENKNHLFHISQFSWPNHTNKLCLDSGLYWPKSTWILT